MERIIASILKDECWTPEYGGPFWRNTTIKDDKYKEYFDSGYWFYWLYNSYPRIKIDDIAFNTCNENYLDGIRIMLETDSNQVINNTCNLNSPGWGIKLDGCWACDIEYNMCNNNKPSGIWLYESWSVNVSWNKCNFNSAFRGLRIFLQQKNGAEFHMVCV